MLTCSNANFISHIFSTISCVSWFFAQYPQIYYNYKHKSANGISPYFLALWFLGDSLSFVSCLFNKNTLAFQLGLSLSFVTNDICLCWQYYYYNYVYKQNFGEYGRVVQTELDYGKSVADIEPEEAGMIRIRKLNSKPDELPSNSVDLNGSYDSINSPMVNAAALVSILKPVNGLPVVLSLESDYLNIVSDPLPISETGQVLAWMCALIYILSRIPQLYKNYTRKSVEGLSPLLFFSAFMGNLYYTLSILTSCEFLVDTNGWNFFLQQLPYIMGSAGTLVFDFAYFYQKLIYRQNQTETFNLQSWDEIETETIR